MSNRLKVQGTQQHLRRLLERCKEAGIPDSTIATMCFTDRSQIRRWREASTNSHSLTWLATNLWQESRVQFRAYLPSLILCSAVPRPWLCWEPRS